MVRVTGNLQIKNGYVRIKPNIPFIGSLSGVSVYEIYNGFVSIELTPTPQDRIYLVDFSLSPDAAFLPTENWVIPNYNCDLDEVRGLTTHNRNLQLQSTNNQLFSENQNLLLQVEKLTLTNNELQLSNNQLLLEIGNLKMENSELQLKIKTLMPEEIHTDEKTLNSSSINILNRFL
jgi:hypothetical protein